MTLTTEYSDERVELVRKLAKNDEIDFLYYLVDRDLERINWDSYESTELYGNLIYSKDLTRALVKKERIGLNRKDNGGGLSKYVLNENGGLRDDVTIDDQLFGGRLVMRTVEELFKTKLLYKSSYKLLKRYKNGSFPMFGLKILTVFDDDWDNKILYLYDENRKIGILIAGRID